MQPVEHAILGSVVSALAVGTLWLLTSFAPVTLAALFAYGLFLSVFIDLDHFPLARLDAGHWGHFREAARNLPDVLLGRITLFEPSIADRLRPRRIASHVVIGTVLAAAGWTIHPGVAGFTVLVVGAHVTCDLLRDREIL
jgi:hypothetical protein